MDYTWNQILTAHKYISDSNISYRHFCNTWNEINSNNLFNSNISIDCFYVLHEITKLRINKSEAVSISDVKTKFLFLRDLQLDNIFPVQEMVDVEVIDCMFNEIDSLMPLKNMKNLKEIFFNRNKISNIEPITQLKKLQILNLSENKIYDITKISLLENLINLDLGGNKISDISCLASLKNLTKLDLTGNNLIHISDLKDLKNLTDLYIDSNTIIFEELIELCKELPSCKIQLSYVQEALIGYLKLYNNHVYFVKEYKGTGNSFHTYIKLFPAENNKATINVLNDMKQLSSKLASKNRFFFNPTDFKRERFPIETSLNIEGQYDYF